MKKFVASLALVPLAFGLAACGSNSSEGETIKIGVTGASQEHEAFTEAAKEEGISVEIIDLADYNKPNPALKSGDIDLNWFQHLDYLSKYNVENDDNLQLVGPTVIYPMALFSSQYDSVEAIPEGGEIAIPNDPSNSGRALLLLEANGLVEFTSETDAPTVDDVDTKKSKVKISAVDATQTVRSMGSVAGSVVNNDFILDAGLDPNEALAMDDPANPSARKYVNAFVSRDGDQDNETYKKLVEIFHSQKVQDTVQEVSGGTAVEVTTDVEELRASLAELEEDLRNS
ncbi:MetQ/NlpA family ABC transporter substrate-binding protein [Rothia sp. ZJ932]|uniref:MetQ/NlpA family ABC transporter substrate-binding protein n=1 Tax=Rothia sp. ZJ932 TaxID=2810516 RepID=UPI00196825B4|nr:MetQ/NlpA family ABC transporter substrate-binding protein [Rothia sp. ZJ932]QRZ61886.1 methionine-binding protein [Rothia sp. ZJ932]